MKLTRPLALAWVFLVSFLFAGGAPGEGSAQSKPEGEMRWALYVTLSPVWFDPASSRVSLPSGCCTRSTTRSSNRCPAI